MVAAGGVVWCWQEGRWLPLQLTTVQLPGSGPVSQVQLDAVRDLLQTLVLPQDLSSIPPPPPLPEVSPTLVVKPEKSSRWEELVAQSAHGAKYTLGDEEPIEISAEEAGPPPPPRTFKHKQPCRQPHKCTLAQARNEWHELIKDEGPQEEEKKSLVKVSSNVLNLQKFYRLVKQKKSKKSKLDIGLQRSDSDPFCHELLQESVDTDSFRSFRKNRGLRLGNMYAAPKAEERYSDEPRSALLAKCKATHGLDVRRYSDPLAAAFKQREVWATHTRKLSDSSLKDP